MTAVLQSWLFAWLFALGISLGSLANLMVHALTGGSWGLPPRRAWRAAASVLPLLALLFVPELFGKSPFFAARAVAYFAVWIALSMAFLRRGGHRLAAGGLIVYALVATFAAYDWIASLSPGWRSTGFGLVVGVGQMLAGMAFGVAVAAFGGDDASRRALDASEASRGRFHDLGNMLLMYVLTWAYLAYTQFLIVWAGDLPKEIQWYVPRLQTGWMALGAVLVAFHFAVPFLILLSRAAKRSRLWLGSVAIGLLVAYLSNAYWLVMPSVTTGPGIADPLALAVMLLICGFAWRRSWRREPAIAEEPAHG